ncbi:hypothetical protein, partial [Frankia sp. CiP3]|uniref:hypothetical protein n=1 Tax=Frankia sp. CiP3 TaxID=2880971 RepID=UPI001EF6D03B
PWHLLLALGRTGLALGERVRLVVGDSRENGALRYVRLMGCDPVVVDGTRPCLPRTELMWPSYEQPLLAKPFAARIPADLAWYMDVVEAGLAEGEPGWQRVLVGRIGAHRRGAGAVGAGSSVVGPPVLARSAGRFVACETERL